MKAIIVILATSCLVSAQPILAQGPKTKAQNPEKRVEKVRPTDELSRFRANQIFRADVYNAESYFLGAQNARGGKDTIQTYQRLTKRELKRKLNWNTHRRQLASVNNLKKASTSLVSEAGYEGIIINYSQFRGYMFQIEPLNGGEAVSVILDPGESLKTTLVAGVYEGKIMDGGTCIGIDRFSVPKRTNVNGQWTGWCFFKKRH
jgi:hypothetical protein